MLVLLAVVGVFIWAGWRWFEQVQARVAADRPAGWQPSVVPARWVVAMLGVGAAAAIVLLVSTHHYGAAANPFKVLWLVMAPAALTPVLALRAVLLARVTGAVTLRWCQLVTLMTPIAVFTCYRMAVRDSDLSGPSTDLAFTLVAMAILFAAVAFWLAIGYWVADLVRQREPAARRALEALWAAVAVGATTGEAARRAGCSLADAERVLFDLADAGAVTRTGGWWQLTEDQRHAAVEAGLLAT